jgi:transcriptional regulator with XRE-family HTH domain
MISYKVTENERFQTIARNVKTYRTRMKWSRGELAEKAGCSIFMIYEIEEGKRPFKTADLLLVATALDVDLTELLQINSSEMAL